MGIQLTAGVEKIVGKGEIAHYVQFLLFPQCFQRQFVSVVDVLKRVSKEYRVIRDGNHNLSHIDIVLCNYL